MWGGVGRTAADARIGICLLDESSQIITGPSMMPWMFGLQVFLQRAGKHLPTTVSLDAKEQQFVAGTRITETTEVMFLCALSNKT